MASEQEEKQARIDRILVRVRAGEFIRDALVHEGLRHWFYGLPVEERAPVMAARREFEYRGGQAKKLGVESIANSFILVEVPTERKESFDALCFQKGTSMNRRINSLIVADLNLHKNTF
ncbi:hypothetical protein GCM10028807_32720 [Spirosoma daeguense]